MIFVLNQHGEPLMPTKRFGKVRRLLKNGQAKVMKRRPFTIQLLIETTHYVQSAVLGVDSGYNYIGISVVTEKEELFSAEVTLLQGQKERNQERAMYRKQKRSRLRYRKARFDNRKKEKRWLAPSVQHKLDSHIRFIENLKKILPIQRTIVEVANFNIQKILNPNIEGLAYQEGVQKDFWNLREYILHRDNHQCQNPNCRNTNPSPILCLHHIIYRSNGGTDSPNNLITLCDKCHTPTNHSGFLLDWRPKVRPLKSATFMSMVRWRLAEQLDCEITYGYSTKSKRIELGISKSHLNDAFVIAGGELQERATSFQVQQVRRNNRSIRRFYDARYQDLRDGEIRSGKELFSGRTKRNKETNGVNNKIFRGLKVRKGYYAQRKRRYPYQPKDTVRYNGQIFEVIGSQNEGKYVKLKDLQKTPSMKLLSIISYGKGFHFRTV